jgi:hypothetical protein
MRQTTFWILLITTLSPHISRAAPPVRACSLLKDPYRYDGQMVHVRARTTGTSEGVWLDGAECPRVFVTDGHVWDSIISVAYPGNYGVHPVDFDLDEQSKRRIKLKYERIPKPLHPECLEWTFTGLFETKRNWTYGIDGAPIGFGHQGGAPAQLIVKSEDDVAVIPNCPHRRR